ncbi:hypothetical protein LINGRAPRIM_LOCUS3421 [Linum grandiflorum]
MWSLITIAFVRRWSSRLSAHLQNWHTSLFTYTMEEKCIGITALQSIVEVQRSCITYSRRT